MTRAGSEHRRGSAGAPLVGAGVLVLGALLAGCGSGSAVSTSTPLSRLGEQMAKPADTTMSLVRGTATDGSGKVTSDGSKDVSCDGGKRREYAATVSGKLEANDDTATVRNRLNLVAQAGLKPSGAKVTTDLGKDASSVPARIDFAAKPSDAAQAKTYRTTVEIDGDTWTWTIKGRTACVTGKS